MPALLEPSSEIADDLEMLCAADYPATDVQWLWPHRIPIGKVTLLVGDPGNGKSLVALDIAARISRGTPWPDLPPSTLPLPPSPASVLILSSEDDIRDTIRPRLDAAGADPHRVFVLPSISDLRHDLEKLRAALDRLPDCRLIVIDPVNSFVGPGDSHFHTIVRRVFEPLAKLAAERGIAVLGVSHLRKHDGAAIQRAAGSMGFVAAARAVWTVCHDPVQADRYLMLQVKNNFAADTAGLAYTISSTINCDEGSSAPHVTWQTELATTSAVEALQPEKKSRGPEPAELSLAIDYVQSELATGPKSAEWMLAGGRGGGFSDATVRRALVAVGGKTRKTRPYGLGSWLWYLPDHDFQDSQTEGAQSESTEPVGEATAPAESQPAEPQAAVPDPSENLIASQKSEDSAQETCPLREDLASPTPTTHPSGLEPGTPPCRGYPMNLSGATRKLWPEPTQTLLTQRCSPDRFVPYEHHLAQSKMMRILKSRKPYHRGSLKRVELDLMRPYTFRHPARTRAP